MGCIAASDEDGNCKEANDDEIDEAGEAAASNGRNVGDDNEGLVIIADEHVNEDDDDDVDDDVASDVAIEHNMGDCVAFKTGSFDSDMDDEVEPADDEEDDDSASTGLDS
jgi:hypothetical protein